MDERTSLLQRYAMPCLLIWLLFFSFFLSFFLLGRRKTQTAVQQLFFLASGHFYKLSSSFTSEFDDLEDFIIFFLPQEFELLHLATRVSSSLCCQGKSWDFSFVQIRIVENVYFFYFDEADELIASVVCVLLIELGRHKKKKKKKKERLICHGEWKEEGGKYTDEGVKHVARRERKMHGKLFLIRLPDSALLFVKRSRLMII